MQHSPSIFSKLLFAPQLTAVFLVSSITCGQMCHQILCAAWEIWYANGYSAGMSLRRNPVMNLPTASVRCFFSLFLDAAKANKN